jgi:hypothetical protein
MSKTTGINIKEAALNNETIMNRIDANTRETLKKNPSSLRSVIRTLMYAICIVGGIGGASEVQLYDTQQAKKVGISDFEAGMKVNSDSIITGIRLEYASGAPGNAVVGDKAYTNLLFSRTNLTPGNVDMDAGTAGVQSTPVPARNLPLTLYNAKLFLYVDGQEKFNCDVKDFFIENDRKDYMSGDPADFKSLLEQLVLVPKGSIVEVKLRTADGVAVAGDVNHFFRWSLQVSQFDKIA